MHQLLNNLVLSYLLLLIGVLRGHRNYVYEGKKLVKLKGDPLRTKYEPIMHQTITLVLSYYYLIGVLRGHRNHVYERKNSLKKVFLLQEISILYKYDPTHQLSTLVLNYYYLIGILRGHSLKFFSYLYDPFVLLLLRFLLSKKNPEPVTLCHYHMT